MYLLPYVNAKLMLSVGRGCCERKKRDGSGLQVQRIVRLHRASVLTVVFPQSGH